LLDVEDHPEQNGDLFVDDSKLESGDSLSQKEPENSSQAGPSAAAPAASAAVEATDPARTSREQAPEGQPVLKLLKNVSLFEDLPDVYLRRIASLCREERQTRGSYLFREGEPGDKIYLICEGAVRVSRQVSGMGEEALAVLGPGDPLGEMALIDDFPRSADAVVHEDTRLLVMSKDALHDLLFVDRDLAYDLLWTFVRTLASRLRQTNDKMMFMAVTSKF